MIWFPGQRTYLFDLYLFDSFGNLIDLVTYNGRIIFDSFGKLSTQDESLSSKRWKFGRPESILHMIILPRQIQQCFLPLNAAQNFFDFFFLKGPTDGFAYFLQPCS